MVALMGVLAPEGNDKLLEPGKTLAAFRPLLTSPDSLHFLPLEQVLQKVAKEARGMNACWSDWIWKPCE